MPCPCMNEEAEMKMLKLLIVVCVMTGLLTHSVSAEGVKRTGKIIELNGKAEVLFSDGKSLPAWRGMVLNEGDTLKTSKESWIVLSLGGKERATVEIDEKSELLLSRLRVDEGEDDQKTLLDLAVGKILIKANKLRSEKSKFEVKTPTSLIGVRGTTFEVNVEEKE